MRNVATTIGALLLSSLVVTCTFGVTRTTDNALLPEGKVAPTRTPKEGPVPLFPPCGYLQIGSGTSNNDGYIDSYEWAGAYVYDVSDTCGQSDGLPNPLGSCYLYLMQDDRCLYFGIDAVADSLEDYYDQCGLYFDDNDDGCFPPAGGPTNEGNIWVMDTLSGPCYTIWRWWQDSDDCAPDTCYDEPCQGDIVGGYYPPEDLCCCGISTQSGHMQIEVGVQFGDIAYAEYMLQTYLNLGETCGFYMYYLDQYSYDFLADFPCTGDPNTFCKPCFWPSLQCVKPEFSFEMDAFQTQVPIGGTLDFAKHFHNNTCQMMTIYDTLKVYKGGNLVKTFTYQWTVACEQDLDLCFALPVPEKDKYICWDLTLCNDGVGVAGSVRYPFTSCFDFHVEAGHKSEVTCP